MSFLRRGECPNCREAFRAVRERDATIRDLNDRLMFLAGNAWNLPPAYTQKEEKFSWSEPERPVALDMDELEV